MEDNILLGFAKQDLTATPDSIPEDSVPEKSTGDSADLGESIRKQAIGRLREELLMDGDRTFAEPVIDALVKRCREDILFAQAILRENKTWDKCKEYLYFEAANLSAKERRCIAVDNDTVYRWAENYYGKDDEDIEKVKKAAEKKHPGIVYQKKGNEKHPENKQPAASVSERKEADAPKSKKKKGNMDGQMDLFSMMM